MTVSTTDRRDTEDVTSTWALNSMTINQPHKILTHPSILNAFSNSSASPKFEHCISLSSELSWHSSPVPLHGSYEKDSVSWQCPGRSSFASLAFLRLRPQPKDLPGPAGLRIILVGSSPKSVTDFYCGNKLILFLFFQYVTLFGKEGKTRVICLELHSIKCSCSEDFFCVAQPR